MATLTRRGSGTPVTSTSSGTWTTATNAVDGTPPANPATYAVWTSTGSSANGVITVTNYDFSSIPTGSTINSVTVRLRHFESTIARIPTVRFTPQAGGGYDLGSQFTCVASATVRDDSQIYTTGYIMDLAELKGGMKVAVQAIRAGVTQSATFNVDHVDVTVDYTPPVPQVTQAAYRFYDEGTETGSTALAAQDTAPSINVGAGDANAQLRVRLQSTAYDPLATDDWQLQWEKNASGTWNNVVSSGGVDSLIDTYDIANRNSYDWLDLSGTAGHMREGGVGVVGNGGYLTKVSFALTKTGSPTGSMEARLYDSWQGSGLRATSLPFSAASLTGTFAWIDFTFDGTYRLQNGVTYYITVSAPSTSTAANLANLGYNSGGGDANHISVVVLNDGSYASNSADTVFRLYTKPAATTVLPYDSANLTGAAVTTNRLGAGSGSFVAGEISEDGVVNDLGWTANNYSELLYSITLKQADLADGDTLRFRILRNGVTTGLTYTATPTISVLKTVGPSDQTWVGSTGTAGVEGVSGAFVASGTVAWSGTEAAVGVAGITGTFTVVTPPQTWSGSTATLGVAGTSATFTPGAFAWSGSTALVGVAGITGTFVETGTPQTWSGSTATVGVAGISAAIVPGPFSWIGSIAMIGVAGTSGAFVVSGTAAWSGSTALVGAAGITGSFVPGTAVWSGSTAAVGVEGVAGAFVSLSFPQTWSGSTATIGAAGISAAFFEQPLPAGTRVLESDHPARIFEDGVYRTFESGVVVNIWNGSVATIGATGVSGSFVASGTVAWSGTVATIGVAGITGGFAAGAGPQTWAGSVATLGVEGISGVFVVGAAAWSGSVASVGVLGVSGAFVATGAVWQGSTASVGVQGITGAFSSGGTVVWSGSTATIGVAGQSALFTQVALAGATRLLETGIIARQLEGGVFREFQSENQVFGTAPGLIGVGGISGTFVEAEASQTWASSPAAIGVSATTHPFGVEAFQWEGSFARIGVVGESGEFVEAEIPMVWFGSVASIGITATSLEWNADYFVYGMWNGQYVVGMMYNAEEIVEVALV